jgi:hypothetical protein
VATEDGTCADENWARMLSEQIPGKMVPQRIFGKNDNRTGYTCLPSDTVHKGDILVLRYAAPWEVGGVTTPVYQDDQFYLRSSLFEGQLFKGSDSDEPSMPLIDAPAVRTAELVAHGYFIHAASTNDKCSTAGKVPSLYRMTLVNGALATEEIAYGVDDFQVQYGVDDATTCGGGTNNDNSIDCFIDAAAAGDAMWGKVIAARIWLLVRAACPETGFTNESTYAMAGANYSPNDGYRRQLYTSTIRLRNR